MCGSLCAVRLTKNWQTLRQNDIFLRQIPVVYACKVADIPYYKQLLMFEKGSFKSPIPNNGARQLDIKIKEKCQIKNFKCYIHLYMAANTAHGV